MPRITSSDVSNYSASLETALLTRQGAVYYWPPKAKDHDTHGNEKVTRPGEGELTSAGTSSSASGKSNDETGSSAQATRASHPSPAHTAGSRSPAGQKERPQRSSSASSTGGSTRETGSSHPSRHPSSEGSQARPGHTTRRRSDTSEEDPGTGGFLVP